MNICRGSDMIADALREDGRRMSCMFPYILRDCLSVYQEAVQTAKTVYLKPNVYK